jgi:1-deoxy-D-xylulose 5-phosphate reductoisomerase
VELFLERRIKFTDIAALVAGVLDKHQGVPSPSIEEIKAVSAWATEETIKTAGAAL